jgi:hypothetical protein
MRNLNVFLLTAAPLIALATGFVLIHRGNAPVMEVIAGTAMYAFIGVLMACYLLRLAMAFLGVIALFRAFQGPHHR